MLAQIDDGRASRVLLHEGAMPGYLRLPIRVDGGLAALRDQKRAGELGVASSYPSTLHALSDVKKRLVVDGAGNPGAEALVRDLITLPVHSLLSARDIEDVTRLF
jgi:dTDP-4-amino-4,6-dideoxygalactose transaminase